MSEELTEDLTKRVGEERDLQAELAEQRRAEAEAATPGEVPTPEPEVPEGEDEPVAPEPEPAPEPTPEPSPEAEAFNKEYARHERAVQKILGDEVPLVACETCEGVGFLPPGTLEPPAYRAHGKYRVCPGCAGEGSVKTGSKIAQLSLAPCPDCNGRGFQERLHAVAPSSGAGEAFGPADESLPAPFAGVQDGAEAEFGTPTWMGNVRAPGS